jgi:hypothetical protein
MKMIYLMGVLACVACSFPSKEDLVRESRRQYEVDLGDDFFINPETQKLAYEIKVKNMAGDMKLQDLTLDVEVYSPDDKVLWTERVTLDVSAVTMNVTKVFPFRKAIEPGVEVGSATVTLAPDNPGSGFEQYPEFQRIVQ